MKTTPNADPGQELPQADAELHNVLVVTPERKLFQVKVATTTDPPPPPPNAPPITVSKVRGEYYAVEKKAPHEAPTRLTHHLAGEGIPPSTAATDNGTAVGILPLRRDPTPANGSSYLLNARRLNPRTIWSDGPWSAPPQLRTLSARKAAPPSFFLIATNEGKIHKVQFPAQELSRDELKHNPDLWRLLRNGLVVGTVDFVEQTKEGWKKGESPVQVVNLATFGPSKDFDAAPAQTFEGTWDFKWAPHSTLRIRLVGGTRNAQQLVKTLSQQWLAAPNPGDLKFQYVADQDEYDLIVNLDPLPQTQTRERLDGSPFTVEVRVPQSDLGTYGLRHPLDKPTTYVGLPAGGISDGRRLLHDSNEYFQSNAFRHIVLHEFGHILGLPHLNQGPDFNRLVTISPSQAHEIRQLLVGDPDDARWLDTQFFRENFELPWPGAQAHSDWPTTVPTPAETEQHIMFPLPIQGLLTNARTLTLAYKSNLDTSDRSWLQMLYDQT